MAIRQGIAWAARSRSFAALVRLLEYLGDRRRGLLRVLTYHRVDHHERKPELFPSIISATPEDFEQQMAYLAENCHVVPVEAVLEALGGGRPLPPRSVLVTFDDAYRDFAVHAWPVMKRYGVRPTLFVPTAFPDDPRRGFWWDRLHQAVHFASCTEDLDTPLGPLPLSPPDARTSTVRRLVDHVKTLPHERAMALVEEICRRLGAPPACNHVLGWNELRQLVAEGVTLGAHTRTHPLVHRITVEQAREEAVGSYQDLKREIGVALPIFAYPSGDFSDEVARMLAQEGFQLAVTTRRGINDLVGVDPLRVRRINVGRRTTSAILRAQLLPWTVYLNRWNPVSAN